MLDVPELQMDDAACNTASVLVEATSHDPVCKGMPLYDKESCCIENERSTSLTLDLD